MKEYRQIIIEFMKSYLPIKWDGINQYDESEIDSLLDNVS